MNSYIESLTFTHSHTLYLSLAHIRTCSITITHTLILSHIHTAHTAHTHTHTPDQQIADDPDAPRVDLFVVALHTEDLGGHVGCVCVCVCVCVCE
jgi:hypothetical protein